MNNKEPLGMQALLIGLLFFLPMTVVAEKNIQKKATSIEKGIVMLENAKEVSIDSIGMDLADLQFEGSKCVATKIRVSVYDTDGNTLFSGTERDAKTMRAGLLKRADFVSEINGRKIYVLHRK
ncbi:hypothetical protein FUAX_51940 (plasmid) [Fulvitalea axinellae]|uniref:Uncharacterized protein n=1 Tax=Fulvitalea axinellae TaxID=1182444 RepID=A0AAU9CY84_9BACT|nr:hypothetical protein FUAX_51940 [Fulvitalea axinellae]